MPAECWDVGLDGMGEPLRRLAYLPEVNAMVWRSLEWVLL